MSNIKRIIRPGVIVITLIVLVVGSFLLYDHYQMKTLESDVREYVYQKNKEKLDAVNGLFDYGIMIETSHVNYAAPRDRLARVMVLGDGKIYTYFKDKDGKIRVEYYVDEQGGIHQIYDAQKEKNK